MACRVGLGIFSIAAGHRIFQCFIEPWSLKTQGVALRLRVFFGSRASRVQGAAQEGSLQGS